MKGTLLVIAGAMSLVASNAQASLVTLQSVLDSPTVIDFSQFDLGHYTFTAGPTEIGTLVGESVTWSANSAHSGFGGGNYGLLGNGEWTDPPGPSGRNGYSFMDNGGTRMTYRFNARPIAGVGGFMNYCAECSAIFGVPTTIQALGLGDVVLESYNIEALAPISTPLGVDAGAFRGILRPADDVYAFRVLNGLSVLDDLAFTRTPGPPPPPPMPEPTTMTLLSVGGLLFGAHRRRK